MIAQSGLFLRIRLSDIWCAVDFIDCNQTKKIADYGALDERLKAMVVALKLRVKREEV